MFLNSLVFWYDVVDNYRSVFCCCCWWLVVVVGSNFVIFLIEVVGGNECYSKYSGCVILGDDYLEIWVLNEWDWLVEVVVFLYN